MRATVEIRRETRARTILPKRFESRPLLDEHKMERVLFIDGCAYHDFGESGSAYLELYSFPETSVYLHFETVKRVKVKDEKGTKTQDPRKTRYGKVDVTRNLTLDNPEVSIIDPKTHHRITFSLDDKFRAYLKEDLAS